jgi:hypothetical protein
VSGRRVESRRCEPERRDQLTIPRRPLVPFTDVGPDEARERDSCSVRPGHMSSADRGLGRSSVQLCGA